MEGGIANHPKGRSFELANLPVVWCDADAERIGPSVFAVVHDSRETARVAIAELLKRNCAAYGYVGFDVKRDWSRVRGEVFAEEMGKAGVAATLFDPTLGRRFRDAPEFYAALEKWLSDLPRPCGIFAANDETALNVHAACLKKGLSIPQDIAIMGFSGCYHGSLLQPSLSTVDFCYMEAASLAVDA